MPVVRVVKVGGSLLDWPELPRALDAWLNEQPSAINVLIAGGGNAVDAIRQASRAFLLDDESAHWLSIDAMSINSCLLADLLPDAVLVSMFGELWSAIETNSCLRIVFDSRQFLREHESELSGSLLPHNWSVTSDSIAARLAEVLPADELVLLKSADPPGKTTTALVDAGFVDRNFPSFNGCSFQRRFVNLRQAARCPAAFEI
jgi:5-(aminomethyl)-3-furanmethanol phosphate kinase